MPPSVSSQEVGVSGTRIYGGRIYSEGNVKLQWEKAYGQPGSSTWGEYEKLMRTDHAVSAALDMIAAKLRDAEMVVDAADETDTAKMHAEFVNDNFRYWLEPKWPTLIDEICKVGLGIGFDIHEIIWGVRDDERVPNGQAVYVKKLAQRLPSSVLSHGWKELDGDLASIEQSGVRHDGYNRWESKVLLPADKVLLFSWNRIGHNYQGFSAFRPIWFLATLRAELLRIMAIGHQREALGIPVVEIDKDSPLSDGQLDELQEFVENIQYHEHAGLVGPKGAKINWLFSPGANKGHLIDAWERLGVAILEVVHAQQMMLGTGATGSRAVGEVHDASKNDFIGGVRAWLEATLNGIGERPYTGIVKKLVDINFGPQRRYPTLSFVLTSKQMDVGELALALNSFVSAGAINLTPDDENDFRARLGMKIITAEERDAAIAAKRALMPQPPQTLSEILSLKDDNG